MLQALAHRGPDGRGVWRERNVLLGHTRLAIRDPKNPGSAQPMVTPCGRYALSYNGEIYNDADARVRLRARVAKVTGGKGFATRCDAETVLWALALDGARAFDYLRGVYAAAFVDVERGTLLLARDPLGVKPLVYSAVHGGGLAFASEPRALLEHPGIERSIDPMMLGAYLATSRRNYRDRTLFEGVRSVLPGDVVQLDLDAPQRGPKVIAGGSRFSRQVAPVDASSLEVDAQRCASVVTDSIQSQLVSDVPLCAFLSGGLDSAIMTRVATDKRQRGGASSLATWCASAKDDGAEVGEDPPAARAFADVIGSDHTDVHVDEEAFLAGWRDHVAHMLQPLSTPNEIAIAETARAIRASGALVALSGEGADEMFGGYDAPLSAFAAHACMPDPPIDAARFHLEVTSWVSPAALGNVLDRSFAEEAADYLVRSNQAAFQRAIEESGSFGTPLDAHLRLQRASNLPPLLERLDAATMRHGVEGRTPFADSQVLALADRIAFERKFQLDPAVDGEPRSSRSKIVLREAFCSTLPDAVVHRPKASFPMPFERWSAAVAVEAARSPFVADWIERPALEAVVSDPLKHWKLSWLIANLGLLGEAAFDVPLGIQAKESGPAAA